MVQLRILNGRKAGLEWLARRFPVRIGRDPSSDLCLDDDGVWERHFEIHLQSAQRFNLSATAEAFTSINGEIIQEAVLRNGDLVEAGGLQIRFELSPTRQRSLRLREVLTWLGLAGVCFGQIALIYWLIG